MASIRRLKPGFQRLPSPPVRGRAARGVAPDRATLGALRALVSPAPVAVPTTGP